MLYNDSPLTSSSELELYLFSDIVPQHSEFLFKLWTSPNFGPSSIDSLEKAQAVITNRFLEEYERNDYGTFILAIPTPSPLTESTPIGTVSLTRGIPPEAFTVPDIGYALLPEYKGNGYATKGAKVLLEYAEKELGIRDILGCCDPDNTASRAVLKRLGFEYRGEWDLSRVMGKGIIENPACVYVLPHMKGDLKQWGLG
jgi:RimJ/RimL family protein N-acetyltransferase